MDTREMGRYRKLLQEITARVRPDVEAVTDQVMGGSGGQAGGQLSNAPMHMGDSGTDEFLHEMNAVLLENEQYLVDESIHALDRIEDGSYGRCEQCDEEIAKERLDAIPYVRLCIVCASGERDESPNLNVGRPRSSTDTMASAESRPRRKNKSRSAAINDAASDAAADAAADTFAAGTAGGGTAIGGLAGTNFGDGDPDVEELQQATGSGNYDVEDSRDIDQLTPLSGRSGGAVGGTPARKRAR
jgi:DnaK suppressor protein